ncbi:hypothetical protein D3C80_1512670 [compost metagenome]
MISRCGNGATASGSGVAEPSSPPVGRMLDSEGLTFPATRLASAVTLDAIRLNVPSRSCTWAAPDTTRP